MSKQPEMVIARNSRATRNNDTTLNLDNQVLHNTATKNLTQPHIPCQSVICYNECSSLILWSLWYKGAPYEYSRRPPADPGLLAQAHV